MSIQKQLLFQEIGERVLHLMEEDNMNLGDMADRKAIEILEEIQELFLSSKDDIGGTMTQKKMAQQDFEILDQILSIFHKNGLKTGALHDY